MAKRQASFNPAAGFFSAPAQQTETKGDNQTLAPLLEVAIEKVVAPTEPLAPATPLAKKEKRIAITFNIDESLDDKLSRFVFERKMAKEKISKTQVITDALVQYLKNTNL